MSETIWRSDARVAEPTVAVDSWTREFAGLEFGPEYELRATIFPTEARAVYAAYGIELSEPYRMLYIADRAVPLGSRVVIRGREFRVASPSRDFRLGLPGDHLACYLEAHL